MKRRLWLSAKIIFTILALYLVFRKIDIHQILALLKQAKLFWVVLAIGSFVLSQIISAFRLNLFFRNIGIAISNLYNIKLYFLGMFYSLILPSEVGGDGYKVLHLRKRSGVGLKPLFWALLLDRLVGLLGLYLLAVLLFYFLEIPSGWWDYIGFTIPLSLIVSYYIGKKYFSDLTPVFFQVLGFSIVVQAVQLLSAFFILLALQHSGQWESYAFLFLMSSVAAAVPITIGGAGARELTFLYGADWLALDVDTAITLSVMIYLIKVLVSLGGGAIRMEDISVSKDLR